MNAFYRLILAVLSVWRVTHLLNAEDGPGHVFVRFRLLAGSGFWGELLDCFQCLSLWVAAPFAFVLADNWAEKMLLWPALSGASILLERTHLPIAASYFEGQLPPMAKDKDKDKPQ